MKRFAKQIPQSLRSSTINSVRSVMVKPRFGPTSIMKSEMKNGIKITSAQDTDFLLAACTIMFQAGSRYETHDDLGATHFLRLASTGGGCRATAFSKLRVLQQAGAYITTTLDRQTIAYTLRCPLHMFRDLKYYLLDTAVDCCYHDWEISDLKPIVRGDLSRIHPEQKVFDLIQKAAWAGSLANSVYCEEERIDSMDGEKLRNYVSMNYIPSMCSVASVGVPFEETMKIAEKIEKTSEVHLPKSHKVSPRMGYEYYDLGPNSDTWIAVAVPSCDAWDSQSVFKHAIIAAACGTENMQEGMTSMDRIAQSPLGLISDKDVHTDCRAFNISYIDTGLFGIIAKTSSCSAHKISLMIAEFLARIGELSLTQIDEGKKRLLLNLAIHDEDCVRICEGLALQSLYNSQIDCAENSAKIIEGICSDEVSATAKALASKCRQMAIAVVGDIGVVPIDQEIFRR
ncbi:unnamed protein product [Danaus chrysippus]|uniref:(African queen) hypothetical protein n=1 Tax=Danaus chrysippus TaxID=151541 RepID=A0A8J2QN96_9NEOP|nr:unnamed protein product [Danaus chrysippus]